MEIAFRLRDDIVAGLRKIGYLWVSLDLTALRSGSLNQVLKAEVLKPTDQKVLSS
jgi:PP-loop superfamily ATP-utilizing enzyme